MPLPDTFNGSDCFCIYTVVPNGICANLEDATLVTGFKDFETQMVNYFGGYSFDWAGCTYKYMAELTGIE